MLRLYWTIFFLGLALASTWGAERGPGPFTHEPRSVRSRDLDQQHVRLDLQFDFDRQQIRGQALHTFTLFRAVPTLTLDAADMKIEKVSVADAADQPDFQVAKFQHQGDQLHIELPARPLETKRLLSIEYTIMQPKHGAHFVAAADDEPHPLTMVWTQSEPEYARYWYPCFDHPSDRLTSEIVATVPTKFTVLSNGVLKEKQLLPNGTTRWHWSQTQSHVPYLLSVVAGEFEIYEQSWDGIPVPSYVPKGRLADAKTSFEKTPLMVKFFSEKLGYRYPWPKYAQICVDEYSFGGMEHTSASTLNLNTLHDARAHDDARYGTDSLVAHELAHQWFGDLVTCKDWSELWLNESFATYFATLWTEQDLGWEEAVWDRMGDAESYFGEDQRYRRAIVNDRYDTPMAMFDSHTYPKGGRVLHMLRFELGDELFWKSLRHYLEVNQYRTVETADLRTAIEDTTGRGMNWFFRQWIERGGHPEIAVAWTYDAERKDLAVTIEQKQKVDAITPLFRASVELEIATADLVKLERISIARATETFHFALEKRPTRVVFDPRDWLLDQQQITATKHELLDQLTRSEHVFARMQAVKKLADQKDDAEVKATLLKVAQADKFWAVRQEAVKTLGKLNGDEIRALLLKLSRSETRVEVRREAVQALQRFPHDDTKRVLRDVVAQEPSYKTVAEALHALVKVDRAQCAADLRSAMERESPQQVILLAAIDGLVELKDSTAEQQWVKMLKQPLSAERRAALLGALARAKPNDAAALEPLKSQLSHRRPQVRKEAIRTLVEIGNPLAIEWLQQRRGEESSPRSVQALDEAIDKIRERKQQHASLNDNLEKLREQNKLIEERLKKLEKE